MNENLIEGFEGTRKAGLIASASGKLPEHNALAEAPSS